jgi:Ca2+-binding EF-hand superfamily protein
VRPILVAIAIGAQAQPGPGSSISVHPLLSALDTNRDGVLDDAELEKAPSALRKLDRDGDGRITPGEMSRMMSRPMPARSRKW